MKKLILTTVLSLLNSIIRPKFNNKEVWDSIYVLLLGVSEIVTDNNKNDKDQLDSYWDENKKGIFKLAIEVALNCITDPTKKEILNSLK